jgi:hypothetical protein
MAVRFSVESQRSQAISTSLSRLQRQQEAHVPAPNRGWQQPIETHARVLMPPGNRYTFDSNAGTESVFIVFSRNPSRPRRPYILASGQEEVPRARSARPIPKELIQSVNISTPP